MHSTVQWVSEYTPCKNGFRWNSNLYGRGKKTVCKDQKPAAFILKLFNLTEIEGFTASPDNLHFLVVRMFTAEERLDTMTMTTSV